MLNTSNLTIPLSLLIDFCSAQHYNALIITVLKIQLIELFQ